MSLRAGDWVEVRSKEEILRSLDSNGRLDGLPFMPQMFEFCGRRLRVYKSAHKTCDTVNGTGGRTLPDGVHLENVRCDGRAYGGCQAACLIFWKAAWLKPVEGPSERSEGDRAAAGAFRQEAGCSEEAVLAGTLAADQPATGGPRYACQATDLPVFTTYLPWWDARQYVRDYTSGNASLGQLVSGAIYGSYYYFVRPGHDTLRKPFRWVYDRVVSLWGGLPFPRRRGVVPMGEPTPYVTLDLQPGELVRVKSYEEILATIDESNKNRGLFFDAEMVPYCGKIFRVQARVSRFIGENTGLMVTLKTPALILENVWCQACYSDRRMHCPRSIYSWWREVWLERVAAAPPVRHDPVVETSERTKDPVAVDA
ncbi:hypothetical protein [Amaricoccus sp.]|uniref:hypothetical protein n=1 Tax=Amaricoccus sp. TaxID=1872485 RepID=UPI00261DE29D|nr:hypothetical protein [Amaricoccus sp.]HRO10712.1 hypothetical protein [Amaricoccus sp.]